MENATEALLIAGGILLGILTVTAFIYMFTNIALIGNAEKEKEEIQRLQEWNAEWESYNKEYLYGTEVITVINKAKQNNVEYDNIDKYVVEIQVIKDASNINEEIIQQAYKTNVFTCEEIGYSDETGRVNFMIFKYVE